MVHPGVLEAAIVAIAHPDYGERPARGHRQKAGPRDYAPEALGEFIQPRFARWQVPDDWIFVEALRKTSMGKFGDLIGSPYRVRCELPVRRACKVASIFRNDLMNQ